MKNKNSFQMITSLMILLFHFPTFAVTWSTTELHYQHGDLQQVGTDGAESDTTVITLQYAHGWQYGSNFFFIDYVNANTNGKGRNPFNTGSDANDFYGEWYSTFSLSALTGSDVKAGFIKDVGLVLGVNVAEAVDSWWLLPGIGLALDIPTFDFANLVITGY